MSARGKQICSMSEEANAEMVTHKQLKKKKKGRRKFTKGMETSSLPQQRPSSSSAHQRNDGYQSGNMRDKTRQWQRRPRQNRCFSSNGAVDTSHVDSHRKNNGNNMNNIKANTNNSCGDDREGSDTIVGVCAHKPPAACHQSEPEENSFPDTTALFASSPGMMMVTSPFLARGREPPSKILDFLFIGGVRDATNADFLRRENIVTVLNVSREEYWSVDSKTVIHTFPVDDTTNADIRQYFGPTYALLEQARKSYYECIHKGAMSSSPPRVLVHCHQGKSRSATIVLAYLIRRNGWTVAEALQYVTRRRLCVEPNLGFIEALRCYQESMDTEVRTQRCRSLGLAVRNLSRGTALSSVHKFFEDHVGCVHEVVAHAAPTSQGNTNNTTTNNNTNSNSDNSSGTNAGCADCRQSSSLLDSPHDCRATDGQSSSSETDSNTLCLVFFSSPDSVRVAKRLHAQRRDLFSELGVVEGKELRLAIPSKLIRVPKTAPAPQ